MDEDGEDHHGESAAFTQVSSVDERNGETGGGFQQTGYIGAHAEHKYYQKDPAEHSGQDHSDDDGDGGADIGVCGFFGDVGGCAVAG